jgi:hypothetical protein
VSAGRSPYRSTSPEVRRTAANHRRTLGSNGTGIPRYTWHEVVAQIGVLSGSPSAPSHPVVASA